MSASTHSRERSLIDRHFAGRSSPRSEAAFRSHVTDCEACRAYYQRHLVLARLDPSAPPPAERLAAGLGLRPAPRGRAVWPVLGLAAAAAALLIVARPRPADEFQARGGPPAVAALEVYRASGGTTRPAGQQIAAGDELAFAYRNPGRLARLVVVGVDEGGHVYWFHPDPAVTEAAVAIQPGPEPRELPEAIRHQYQGRKLRILGVFGDDSLSAGGVRRWLDGSGCERLRARLNVQCVTVSLDVEAAR
jgi:hypothetical protein